MGLYPIRPTTFVLAFLARLPLLGLLGAPASFPGSEPAKSPPADSVDADAPASFLGSEPAGSSVGSADAPASFSGSEPVDLSPA